MTDRREKVLELLETSGRRLHALLYRLTLRADVAEELLQELMLRLLQSKGFGQAESPEAFAVRASINLAFDWRRRQRRQQIRDIHERPVRAGVEETVGADRVVLAEEFNELVMALDKLSSAQRQIIVLHYLEQESFESIAAGLRRTAHQVRALCHKGMMRLRVFLGRGHSNEGRVPAQKIAEVPDESR